tara:strand:+ start:38927 stop:39274 length:348 start_codon:yes stop_codon:yes gene_type:complete
MPELKLNPNQLYYSIGEVAQIFNVSTSLIRFWEKEFDTIKPQKNKNGVRQYRVKDLEHINLIYNLVKERKFTLEGAKDKLVRGIDPEMDKTTVLQKLSYIREELMKLKTGMDQQD